MPIRAVVRLPDAAMFRQLPARSLFTVRHLPVAGRDEPPAAVTRLVSVHGIETDPGALDARGEERLWLRQLYAGLIGIVCGGGGALYYVISTWNTGPHRVALAALCALAGVQMVLFWALRHRIVAFAVRRRVFVGWSLFTYALVAAGSALDGGLASPIAMMWTLPTVYLLLGYAKRDVVGVGVVAIALYVAVAWFEPGPVDVAACVLQIVVLVDAMLIVLLGVHAREERQGELRELRRQLLVLATTDSQTGCYNQQTFVAVATAELQRALRDRHAVSLLALDVDHFKLVNDSHGHLVGDQVLGLVGSTLRASVRGTDVVARVGGDEFLVLCPQTDERNAVAVTERICTAIAALPLAFKVTLSIGICTLPPRQPNLERLRTCADQALYDAKQRGRNCYVVASAVGVRSVVAGGNS